MKRKLLQAVSILLISAFVITSSAFTTASNQAPKLLLNDSLVKENVYITDGVMYAPLRQVCEYFGYSVSWNDCDKAAHVNSLCFSVQTGCCIIADRIYAPVRMIASAVGKAVYWDSEKYTAYLFAQDTIKENANAFDDDIYWLSKIIYAEAGGEPMEGKIAVGNVILNRVASVEFPDTVYDVIFDRNYGVQFTPVLNGRIYCTADEASTRAAERALKGENFAGESLYFFNPDISQSFWIAQNRSYVITIGGHLFYS